MRDPLGLPLSGADGRGLARYVRGIRELQCFAGDPVGSVNAAIASAPGFVMALFALYHGGAKPDRARAVEAIAGNLCRCTGYLKIFEAVELAAARCRGEKAEPSRESIHGH